MTTGPAPAARAARWRPWWATVIAVLFGGPAFVVFGMGAYAAVRYAGANVGMSGLVAVVGAAVAVAALPAVVPFFIYLVRGGRLPLWIEVGYVLVVCIFAWFVMPGGASFGWFGYTPIR